jgi:hypothetical protein
MQKILPNFEIQNLGINALFSIYICIILEISPASWSAKFQRENNESFSDVNIY